MSFTRWYLFQGTWPSQWKRVGLTKAWYIWYKLGQWHPHPQQDRWQPLWLAMPSQGGWFKSSSEEYSLSSKRFFTVLPTQLSYHVSGLCSFCNLKLAGPHLGWPGIILHVYSIMFLLSYFVRTSPCICMAGASLPLPPVVQTAFHMMEMMEMWNGVTMCFLTFAMSGLQPTAVYVCKLDKLNSRWGRNQLSSCIFLQYFVKENLQILIPISCLRRVIQSYHSPGIHSQFICYCYSFCRGRVFTWQTLLQQAHGCHAPTILLQDVEEDAYVWDEVIAEFVFSTVGWHISSPNTTCVCQPPSQPPYSPSFAHGAPADTWYGIAKEFR